MHGEKIFGWALVALMLGNGYVNYVQHQHIKALKAVADAYNEGGVINWFKGWG